MQKNGLCHSQGMEATAEQAEAFVAAVSAQMVGWTRDELAEAVAKESGESVSVSALSLWLSAKAEPSRRKVFALEKVLGCKPGALSRHLGYLPINARDVVSVEDALEADGRISAEARRVLLSGVKTARDSRA